MQCAIGYSSWATISILVSCIHWLSAAQATAGDISAPLNSIVWNERDACESLQLYIWNHAPIPLRTRPPLHSTKLHRPFAIFRCEGSKFITEGGHWDSWISTSSTSHVIMHLYLFTSSSLSPYHNQIQIPVSQYYILQCVLSSTNINVCGRILRTCFTFRPREEVKY